MCSDLAWCIAYSSGGGGDQCALITSTGSCAKGTKASGHTARTFSDLSASGTAGYNCMAKLQGKNPYVALIIRNHETCYVY